MHTPIAILVSLFIISCAPQTKSDISNASSSADVDLLEADQKLNENDLMLTFSSDLKTPDFRTKVYSQIKSRFVGIQIKQKGESGSISFDGKLEVFTAHFHKHEKLQTSSWPRDHFKDEHYDEVRNTASEAKLVAQNDADTIRIYYTPINAGYEDGKFKVNPSLIIAKIDPNTGNRKTYSLKDEKLYLLKENPKYPQSSEEASVHNELEAGERVKADVRVYERGKWVTKKDKIIPSKVYSTKSYRPGEDTVGETISADLADLVKVMKDAEAGKASDANEAALKTVSSL